MAAPIILTAETTGAQARLEGADLPEPGMEWGGSVQEQVTHYSDEATSVQLTGWEAQEVDLEGTFSDRRWGEEGHAIEMRDALEAISRSGEVVRFEYEDDQRWGTLDAEFEEERRGRINYTLTFRPHWTEPPELSAIAGLQTTAPDLSLALRQKAQGLKAAASGPPDPVRPGLVQQILTTVASIQNDISKISSALRKVERLSDLALDLASQMRRQAFGTIDYAVRLATRTRNATPADVTAQGGTAEVSATRYTHEVERESVRTGGELNAFLLALQEAGPSTSRQVYIVQRGDTLQSIAQEELGDFSRWVDIAQINELENSNLSVGDPLVLPSG